MLFVDYLRSQPLFHQLATAYQTVEGTLLELADPLTMEAQVEALRYALYRAEAKRVLETGTAKGMFAYFLSHVLKGGILYTFDHDKRSQACVEQVDTGQSNLTVHFTLGDTKVTLAAFREAIDFAWIDGGHDHPAVESDLGVAMALRIRLIAVDDTRTMPEVRRALQRALERDSSYKTVPNPFFDKDGRGITLIGRG